MAAEMEGSSSGGCLEKLTSYVRTRKGTILAAEIILGFIILICYAMSIYGGYTAVAICETVIATVFFVVFMLELDKQFRVVHWIWSDLIRAVIGAALYLITSLICVFRGHGDGALITGGVFGLVAGVLYAYDAYTIYLVLKSSRENTAAPTDITV
ncbi:proteolipid protein 2 isoform X2 [Carassius gibelio]|uniref:proteolipid protein 2 isoform X2 n=1 Tax=Carassius gibelio TaxID=101364 RepID=UPI00227982DC|nr:proteolipid protein 2 isoform X2 [Carassius gibelio]